MGLIDLTTDPKLAFDDLGEQLLAKKFGSARLWCLRRVHEPKKQATDIPTESPAGALLAAPGDRVHVGVADIPTESPSDALGQVEDRIKLDRSFQFKPRGRAIAIGAHWDDVLLGCFGTLLRLKLIHQYDVSVVVLCTHYGQNGEPFYYGSKQPEMYNKIAEIYKSLSDCGIHFDSSLTHSCDVPDHAFAQHEKDIQHLLQEYASRYKNSNLVFAPPHDDKHSDHACVGRLVQEFFCNAHHMILEYRIKDYGPESFTPNILVDLDLQASAESGQKAMPVGDLKIGLLSSLIPGKIDGAGKHFSKKMLTQQLRSFALWCGSEQIKYCEGFRGRIVV